MVEKIQQARNELIELILYTDREAIIIKRIDESTLTQQPVTSFCSCDVLECSLVQKRPEDFEFQSIESLKRRMITQRFGFQRLKMRAVPTNKKKHLAHLSNRHPPYT